MRTPEALAEAVQRARAHDPEVLVEELADAQQITELLERLARGELVARTIDCVTGRTSLQTGHDGPELAILDDRITKTFGPAWQLLLIGEAAEAPTATEVADRALGAGDRGTLDAQLLGFPRHILAAVPVLLQS